MGKRMRLRFRFAISQTKKKERTTYQGRQATATATHDKGQNCHSPTEQLGRPAGNRILPNLLFFSFLNHHRLKDLELGLGLRDIYIYRHTYREKDSFFFGSWRVKYSIWEIIGFATFGEKIQNGRSLGKSGSGRWLSRLRANPHS